jgi:DNA repair exonuclease SbcCD nuclease subunit
LRFIHAADIHLDSPLSGLRAYEDAPAERLRGATREAFRRLVDIALEERVDFLVIAGDLYDGDWKDFNTGLTFCREMGRLDRAGIPTFVLFGNHDAESLMTRSLPLPANVRCFPADRCEVFRLDDLRVALHGRSFKDRDTRDNLVRTYTDPVPGYFNVGVLHTALEGNYSQHAAYAPCSLDELRARGYDYWALGHVHEFQLWNEVCTICFPGNLQGRHIRETGPRGAVMVTVDENEQPRVERLISEVLRWERVHVDVSACDTLDAVGDAVQQALSGVLATQAHVPRAVRLELEGESPIHGLLFERERELRALVLAGIAATAPETLWLEKVRLATRPAGTAPEGGASADALSELETLLNEARTDEELTKQLRDAFAHMLGKVPHDLFPDAPQLAAIRGGELDAALDEVIPGLLARLGSED